MKAVIKDNVVGKVVDCNDEFYHVATKKNVFAIPAKAILIVELVYESIVLIESLFGIRLPTVILHKKVDGEIEQSYALNYKFKLNDGVHYAFYMDVDENVLLGAKSTKSERKARRQLKQQLKKSNYL